MLHSTPRPGHSRENDAGLSSLEQGTISFQDISRFLRRHFAIIASCCVVSLAIALFLIYSAQHRYTARAQILIDPNTTHLLRDPQAGPDRSLDTAQVEGQVAVLRSESLAYTVIGKLKLTDDPEFQGPPTTFMQEVIATVKTLLGFGERIANESAQDSRQRTALDVFFGGLDVRRVGTSYAIDIFYTSVDPDKAARIANEVASAYIDDQLKAMSRAAQQGSAWLETRLNQLRAQLNVSARQLESFKAGRDFRAPSQRRDVEAKDSPSAPLPQGAADIAARDKAATGQQRDTEAGDPSGSGSLTLAELQATTESYRKTYEAYQQAFTEAVQRQSFPVSNARIITAATKPLSKSAPRGRLILAFAGLTGLLTGLALAFLRQSADHTVRSARQVKASTGLPCLAMMPRLRNTRPSAEKRPRLMKRVSAMLGGKSTAAATGRDARPSKSADYNFRIAIEVPFSPFTSALKTLRTAIAHADPQHPMRCIGITSALPREGKSMVAGNLATLYTLSAGRTLIVDADIHNSTISRHFTPGATIGLLDVVTGVAELDKAIVKGSGFVPDVLPVAVKEAAPVSYEQLTSEKMQALLKLLRERYDMVILDLPPVNPIIDGVAIAALLDGVVLVAEWGRTPAEVLAEVTATFHTAQANLLGIVLSKVERSAATLQWRKDWGYGYYPMGEGGGSFSRFAR